MTDFTCAQESLAAARAHQDAAQAAAAQAAARQQMLAAALTRAQRSAGRQDGATARLAAMVKQAADEAATKRAEAGRAANAAAAALRDFAAFSDPRRNVSFVSDALPFALFPVRIETRFGTVGSGDSTQHQLWMRIYPDDCSIDTFEDMLSATELANAKLYWQGIYRAGGIEFDQRAAWRSLVAAHGSGRAGYIADTYQPINLPPPTKAAVTDVILVIATQTPLAPAEAAAITAYWQAVWLADGDAGRLQAAQTGLETAVGAARAAELIVGYEPFNLAARPAPPLDNTGVALSTAFVILPPDPVVRQSAWSQAPQVRQFPERFVVIGFNGENKTLEAIGNVVTLPLYVGPDPSADPKIDPTSAIHPDGGDLFVPDQLKWMVDFERALDAGMALAIDLTAAQARTGFDRLLVLGLQLGGRQGDGKAALEQLLRHHAAGRSGLALIPQGTPAHNSSDGGSGFTKRDDPDQSFDDRKNAPLITPTNPMLKSDGQWLAELLGVDPALFAAVHGADGKDQMRARAMQRALWPATIGYWMDKLMTPVFSDDAIANTRAYFTQYVSGRGAVPAIRVGGQPYGILPTTAFSRIRWVDAPQRGQFGDPQLPFLRTLLAVLRAVDADWTAMAAGNAHVGRPGDAHQTLLDVIGLHPSSVEYYSRSAESLSELFNFANLWGFGPDFVRALEALALHAGAAGLLSRLGYTGTAEPEILQHYFLRDAGRITTVIDDLPLSETQGIRAWTDDDRNYIQWLIDAAGTSLDALRTEQGFKDNVTPQMLLYLYLRHALMLGYYDTSYELHKSAGFLTTAQLAAMKPEPTFVHVADAPATGASESRFAALYKTEARITGSPTLLVTDFIASHLDVLAQSRGLKDQIDALKILVDARTADLERAFAEHIDTCTYRFDAWLLGLVNYQLQKMRQGDGETSRAGIYLGADAWVEDLRPSTAQPTPVELPPDLAGNFAGAPIVHDPKNGGHVHAPSLTQARTAAVLRSGYLANATSANPQTLAVNLSSARVRLALSLLEGIRNGQSLSALLGYRFERGLHHAHPTVEVDKFIFPLRKAFPLVADSLAPTKTLDNVPIEAIEARNVLDGRKLLAQIASSGVTTYPFGLTMPMPNASNTEAQAITDQATALRDLYDALSDLALAEGVHQAVQGNFDRIASTLEAYSTGNFPPEPQVVETPPSGIGLTHRVAVHLKPGLAPTPGATPRAQAEPAVDDWLAHLVPPLDKIGCVVTWIDHAGTARQQPVTIADLGLRPIDLVWLVRPDAVQTMAELDDRVLRFAIAAASPRADAALSIAYMTAPAADAFSLFAVSAQLRSLRTLVIGARPLRATDAALGIDAKVDQNASVFADRTRIAGPDGDLATLGADVDLYLGPLTALLADLGANREAIISGIDDAIDRAVALLERAARFGLPSSGWGFAYAWRRAAVADLLAQVQDLVTRWTASLNNFDNKITAYDNPPGGLTDDELYALLRAAEMVISTQPIVALTSPAALRGQLNGKRHGFATRLGEFAAFLDLTGTRFADFLEPVAALLPVTPFDPHPFDLTPLGDRAVRLAHDLAANLAAHRVAISDKHNAVQQKLAAYDSAAAPADKVQALQQAAQALFGDEFRIVPEFTLAPAQADEWANAFTASPTLLTWLTGTAGIDRPVDEWFTGVARVRPMLHAFESVTLLAGAFGLSEPVLVPVQFPFVAGAPWLAMQFPPDAALDSERLMYTAQYSTTFDKTARQCGLLLDEWTEAIPETTRTTGITFNFDRPDNEPPQTILLVTPASATGTWQWDDLVGALNETLDLAKKRSVEPGQLDATPYTALLPATVMAATLYGISISTSLAAANGVFRAMEPTHA